MASCPYSLLVPVVVLWFLATQQTEPAARMATDFQLGGHRVPLLFMVLAGGRTNVDGILTGLLIFAAPFIGGAKFSTQPWRWTMFVISAVLFFGAPHFIFGTAFIYQRFVVFCISGLLLALDTPSHRNGTAPAIWSCAIPPALTLILLLSIGVRFAGFNRESDGLDKLLAQIPRGARLLYLPVDRFSANTLFPVFLHSGMWHQVRQGGVTDFSFARSQHEPISILRWRCANTAARFRMGAGSLRLGPVLGRRVRLFPRAFSCGQPKGPFQEGSRGSRRARR